MPTVMDVVFEGGGARGLALNGAVDTLLTRGHRFGRLVGTSAGAITATLLAAGFTGEELRAVSLETTPAGVSRMSEFLGDPAAASDEMLLQSGLGSALASAKLPVVGGMGRRTELWVMREILRVPWFANVFGFLEQGGFFGADGFIAWLREKLASKGHADSTFAELHAATGVHLSVVVSDTTRQTMLVLNHVTAPDCPVLWAVRMSMSLPFLWPEVVWHPTWGAYRGASVARHTLVDGGVVSNFALRLLVSTEDWVEAVMGAPPDEPSHVLGLSLDHQGDVPGAPVPKTTSLFGGAHVSHSRLIDRVERLLDTMMSAGDLSEVRNHPDLVCHLPVKGYGVAEFHMDRERVEALLRGGSAAMEAWLDGRELQKRQAARSALGGGG